MAFIDACDIGKLVASCIVIEMAAFRKIMQHMVGCVWRIPISSMPCSSAHCTRKTVVIPNPVRAIAGAPALE